MFEALTNLVNSPTDTQQLVALLVWVAVLMYTLTYLSTLIIGVGRGIRGSAFSIGLGWQVVVGVQLLVLILAGRMAF